jgi:hypothetical protein
LCTHVFFAAAGLPVIAVLHKPVVGIPDYIASCLRKYILANPHAGY